MLKTKLLAILTVIIITFSVTSYSYACIVVKPQPVCLHIEFTSATAQDNEKTYNTATLKAQISPCRDTIAVKIGNAYPGYHATIKYTIKNTGTAPVQFYSPTINNPNPRAIQVCATNLRCVVLWPGQTVQGTLTVQVLEGAQQNQQCCFEVKNTATQK